MQPYIAEHYQAVLDRLVACLREDYYVLAAILYGSLVRGEAWERSDIDLILVLRNDQERSNREIWLAEDDINVSADLVTRNQFKRWLGRPTRFIHTFNLFAVPPALLQRRIDRPVVEGVRPGQRP